MGRHKKEIIMNQPEDQPILPEIEQKVEEIKVREEVDIPEFVDTLPPKPLLRVSEVADYFDVTERTVYLWIQNGHLQTIQTPRGQWRITRESIDSCRFKKKIKEGYEE
jgi:excisionase family DNA binding protein